MSRCGCKEQPAHSADDAHPEPRFTVADVLRAGLPVYTQDHRLPAHHWKTLNAITSCHTPRLGGHLYRCLDCSKERFVPHSCRNRHCPSCQKKAAVEWLEKQTASLLPVPYFHVVFTLPHELNALIAQNQRALYNLLFSAASETLLKFGEHRLKAQIGITAVLHTWSQTLLDHYHLHCIVTGGGLMPGRKGWKSASDRYLFPVKALAKVFQAKFRDGLKDLYACGALTFHGQMEALGQSKEFRSLLARAVRTTWVVYSKKPFAGPRAVLAYLSRYTHRVAIGNGRIRDLDPHARKVTFSHKDYRDKGRCKKMVLGNAEFTRRFCLHILPERFVKIRHYGLLGNNQRAKKIEAARLHIGAKQCAALPEIDDHQTATITQPLACQHCGSRNMTLVERREPLAAAPLDSS